MTSNRSQVAIRNINLQQPLLRKGSYSSLSGIVPLLDIFVAGPENASVHECVSPLSVRELVSRSPLLIYGPSGSGKTSIALTLATRWSNEFPDCNLTITSGGDFSRAYLRAIESDDMERFRQLHRNCDLLVFDNVHELASKPAAQDEFIANLSYLVTEEKCVIVTASDLPPLTPNLKTPLSSRLSGGYSFRLQLPGVEARQEILSLLAVQASFRLSGRDVDAIASQLPDGTTALQLRGILASWAHQERMEPNSTEESSERFISQLIDAQTPRLPTINEIGKLVAKELNVTLESLKGPTRKSSVVRARGLAMYLMRKLTDTSFQSIGKFFGGRDHTTVMHACKKTEDDLAQDHELTRSVNQIQERLKVGCRS